MATTGSSAATARVLAAGFLLIACDARPGAVAGVVRVAAAADLRFVLDRLSTAFAAERPGTSVQATYGASGSLAAQIAAGGPFDVLLSADRAYPERLAADGLVDGAPFDYATGRLVVWTSERVAADVAARGLAALADATIVKASVADPSHAPYGRAAIAALKNAGVYHVAAPKLVYGSNVAQAAQFAESGAADAAVLAHAVAAHGPLAAKGRRVDVPADLHPPVRQAGCVLKSAGDPAAARAFAAFLRGSTARAVLADAGFGPPAP
ncbi:MAG TPA: molybdate ABC transporter substrate-binding protein [Planctomycetota bacterium]|nr:molybdate ABC transporter substrate-binding protein [Planctomycetota bacterium]